MTRKLPNFRRRTGDERGATLILVAIGSLVLLGATCLAVDTSNVVFQKGRAQHAADAAAFAVAYDCVSKDVARKALCTAFTGQPTVDEFIAENATEGDGAITDIDPLDHVTVEVDKEVDLYFGPVIGIGTRDVDARATVAWSKTVTTGKVIPYAVSICHWATTPLDTTTVLDATLNDNGGDIKDWSKFDDQTGFDTLPPSDWRYCDDAVQAIPSGVTIPSGARTIRDGLWFSNDACDNDIANGASTLSIHEIVCGTKKNTNPAWKYEIEVGETLLLAIYAPAVNWPYGGLCSDGAGEFSKCPSFSSGLTPAFELEIVGFVPFEVEGYRLGQPAAVAGDAPAYQGLKGKFVTSSKEFEDAEYGDVDNNFGAVKVELVE